MEAWQLISLVLFVALVSSFVMAWILSKRMISITNNLTAMATASADARGGKSGTPIMAWVAIGFAAFVIIGSLMAEQARQSAAQATSVPESVPVDVEVPAIAATEAAPVAPAVTAAPEAIPATAPEWFPVIAFLVGLNIAMLIMARAAVAHARKKIGPRAWEIEPETPLEDFAEEVSKREKA